MDGIEDIGGIDVDGCRLAVRAVGDGEPLVLVHGTGAQASLWGGCIDSLAAGGYRVGAYDRRGYGGSVPRPVRDYRTHVADLAAVIERTGAPAHVFGWSSGGNTALALAVERPELLRSVVVLEAPWHGIRGAEPTLLKVLAAAKIHQLRGRPRDGLTGFYRWASGRTDGPSGFDRLAANEQEELFEDAAAVLAEFDPHPFGLMMEHVRTTRLAACPVPITWLLGGASRSWYAKLHARVARRVSSLHSAVIPGVGHLAHVEDPDAFTAAVLRALSGAA